MTILKRIQSLPKIILNGTDFYILFEEWTQLMEEISPLKNRNELFKLLLDKLSITLPDRVFNDIFTLKKIEEEALKQKKNKPYLEAATRSQVYFILNKAVFKMGYLRILREFTCYEIAAKLKLEKYMPTMKIAVLRDLELKKEHAEFYYGIDDGGAALENLLYTMTDYSRKYPSYHYVREYAQGVTIQRAIGSFQVNIPNILKDNFSVNPDEHIEGISNRMEVGTLFEFSCLSVILASSDLVIRDVKNSNVIFQWTKEKKLSPYKIDFEDAPAPYVERLELNNYLYPCAFCNGLLALPLAFQQIDSKDLSRISEHILKQTENIDEYLDLYRNKICELYPYRQDRYEVDDDSEIFEGVTFPIPMQYKQFKEGDRIYQHIYASEQVGALKKRIMRIRSFFNEECPRKKSNGESICTFDLVCFVFPDYLSDWNMLKERGFSPFYRSRLIGSSQSRDLLFLGALREDEMQKGNYP